jgi:hypothetical protein
VGQIYQKHLSASTLHARGNFIASAWGAFCSKNALQKNCALLLRSPAAAFPASKSGERANI